MALCVWLASGIFSMVGAYCYAELGCMIRKTGGDYAYVMETFGGFLAFMRLYVESMIIRPCTVAIVALSFAVYSVKYVLKTVIFLESYSSNRQSLTTYLHIFNIFQPFRYVFPECDPPDEAVRLLAAICIGEFHFLENKDKETRRQ